MVRHASNTFRAAMGRAVMPPAVSNKEPSTSNTVHAPTMPVGKLPEFVSIKNTLQSQKCAQQRAKKHQC
jgi:hypothetical protein